MKILTTGVVKILLMKKLNIEGDSKTKKSQRKMSRIRRPGHSNCALVVLRDPPERPLRSFFRVDP